MIKDGDGILHAGPLDLIGQYKWTPKHPAYIEREKSLLLLDNAKLGADVFPTQYRWIIVNISEYGFGNWIAFDSRHWALRALDLFKTEGTFICFNRTNR